MFCFKVGGVQTCLKKTQRCNLFPQCDPDDPDSDKTAKDELDCYEEYKENGLIPKEATFRCQSPHHNEDTVKANLSSGVVYIKAVLQDGVPECWKNEDESRIAWYYNYLPIGDNNQSTKSLCMWERVCLF